MTIVMMFAFLHLQDNKLSFTAMNASNIESSKPIPSTGNHKQPHVNHDTTPTFRVVDLLPTGLDHGEEAAGMLQVNALVQLFDGSVALQPALAIWRTENKCNDKFSTFPISFGFFSSTSAAPCRCCVVAAEVITLLSKVAVPLNMLVRLFYIVPSIVVVIRIIGRTKQISKQNKTKITWISIGEWKWNVYGFTLLLTQAVTLKIITKRLGRLRAPSKKKGHQSSWRDLH